MGWFGKGSDCTLTNFNLRLKEIESRPMRELDEIKRDIVTDILLQLKKTEERLIKYFAERQQNLFHLVTQLEGRIMTLEAKEEFNKPRKVSKK